MKPILFNTQMVQAILEGRKTVTRRLVTFQPGQNPRWSGYIPDGPVLYGSNNVPAAKSPYQPGDILYVRETWQFFPCFDCVKSMCDTTPLTYEDSDSVTEGCWIYKADYIEIDQKCVCWRPSIHMPKEAARIFLRVKDVRVERLQEIDCAGALAEGCDGRCDVPSNGAAGVLSCVTRDFSVERFQTVWDNTVPRNPNKFKRYPFYWKDNPWVWVIEFDRISRKEANNA